MTISSPTFQRLQSGIKAADDLRVKEPINAMMAWLSGGLVTQLNTHFGAVSNSISAALATFVTQPHSWTSVQTIVTTAQTPLVVQQNDDGAAAGPIIDLVRNSASPAVADVLGRISFKGNNSIGASTVYALIHTVVIDPSNGSEDAELLFFTQVAGAITASARIASGMQIGSPTGGYQGAGTLNLDNALYKDGTQVVSSRVTGYGDPFGAVSRATISVTTVTTAALASFVAAMYTDLKAHGLIGN